MGLPVSYLNLLSFSLLCKVYFFFLFFFIFEVFILNSAIWILFLSLWFSLSIITTLLCSSCWIFCWIYLYCSYSFRWKAKLEILKSTKQIVWSWAKVIAPFFGLSFLKGVGGSKILFMLWLKMELGLAYSRSSYF